MHYIPNQLMGNIRIIMFKSFQLFDMQPCKILVIIEGNSVE